MKSLKRKILFGRTYFNLANYEKAFYNKAAGERNKDGNIFVSIQKNKKRFNMSDQLCKILENTADYLGYERPKE